MRAARLREPGTSPVVELVPVPQPERGEVRVATRACGVCATDLHIIDGDTKAGTPVTLGHEIAGVVDAVGPGVDPALIGQRVAVNSMIVCGECAPCRSGEPYLCRRPTILGLDRDGGHADFVIAPAPNCVPLPDAVDFATGAMATDAIGTPLQAIRRSEVKPGATVAVFGLGGLGLHAAIMLKQLYQATVIGVDSYDGALERAPRFGIDHVVDERQGSAGRAIRALVPDGVDASFDFVGAPGVIDQGLRALRLGGTCVAVGVVSDRLDLSVRQETLVGRQLTLRGSFGFRDNSDICEIFDLIASRQLDISGTITHLHSLDDYGAAIERLRNRTGNPIRVSITM
jgi:propanol-preferring alcohol dehydrogenase